MKVESRIVHYLAGPRYTLWTFIKYYERSKDPAHCRRLKKQMQEKLRQLHSAGRIIKCRSIRGGVSYKPMPLGNVCPF